MPTIPENKDHTDRIYQRIDAIILLMLENDRYLQSKRSKELTEIVAAQFDISEDTARKNIQDARLEINKMSKIQRQAAFDKAIRDREYLISKMIKKDLLKEAHVVMKDRDELRDLYPDKKIKADVTNKNIDLDKFTNHGLMRIVRGDPVEEVMLDPESVKLK